MHKNILITGASSGIGAELARQYARAGVQLFLNGRNEKRLASVAAECSAKGADVIFAAIDVRAADVFRNWLKEIHNDYGIDLVIANAGIAMAGTDQLGQANQVMDTNVQGVMNTLAPILPQMIKTRRGHIAVMGSMAGIVPLPSAPIYSASKAAIHFYTQALRQRVKKYDITVTLIMPGFVRSALTEKNDFPMPFFMETDKAAAIIRAGLSRQKCLIAFPLRLHLWLSFLAIMPRFIREFITDNLPVKEKDINSL